MRKTPVWQYILLVVLLGGLGFAITRMVGNMNAAGPAPATPAARQAAPGPATATDTPEVPGTAASRPTGSSIASAKWKNINPNLFKVFQLKSPKNPFVQKEEWYAETLENLPGYPQLKDSDFLNTMDPFLPDMPFIYENPGKWDSVTIQKRTDNVYNLTGISDDGQISTSIQFQEDTPTDYAYAWSKDSGVPLAALKNPDWVKEQINRRDQESIPGNQDLFTDTSGQGLPVPGLNGGSGEDQGVFLNGDTFECNGVSANKDRTSALIIYNGQPRLVKKGMVLPTHYKVLEINADGVVLVDLRDDSTVWIPLAE